MPVVVLALAGCSGSKSHTLTGRIALLDSDGWKRGYGGGPKTSCHGTGGYADLDTGTQVVVKSNSETVAVGELLPGVAPTLGSPCKFRFKIDGVPDRGFYTIEVSHRGALEFSRKKLDGQGWKVYLTI